MTTELEVGIVIPQRRPARLPREDGLGLGTTLAATRTVTRYPRRPPLGPIGAWLHRLIERASKRAE